MNARRTARTAALGALAALVSLAALGACGRDEPAASAGATQPATDRSTPATAPATEGTAETAAGAAAAADAQAPSAALSLAPDQVANIDGEVALTWTELERYLGTVYARLPEGEDALQQLVTEAVIDAAAAEAGVSASEDEINALQTRLEAQAREASGGKLGLQESLGEGVTMQDLRAALRLQVLHESIVRHEQGLPPGAPLEAAQLKAWVDAHLPGESLEHPPLDDALAARWPGGELTKVAVGRRLRSLLPADEVSGVLTEMIGVLLVRREAARLGLVLTPAEATKEVLERNTVLHAKAGADDISYDQFVETIQKRSLKEILASDQFGAEVLLRLISERTWTEDSARAEWEQHPEKFPLPATPVAKVLGAASTPAAEPSPPEPHDWEHMRTTVWRALRQDSYARLFQQSRIVRRLSDAFESAESSMFIGKVVGTVVSSIKDPKVASLTLQIVQELDEHNRPRGKYVVAVDTVGAGQGDLVLFAQGSSARQTTQTDGRPIDAAIFAVIDSWDVEGRLVYQKEGLEVLGASPAED